MQDKGSAFTHAGGVHGMSVVHFLTLVLRVLLDIYAVLAHS